MKYWVYVIETFDEEPGYITSRIENRRLDAEELTRIARSHSVQWNTARVRVTEHKYNDTCYTYVPLDDEA